MFFLTLIVLLSWFFADEVRFFMISYIEQHCQKTVHCTKNKRRNTFCKLKNIIRYEIISHRYKFHIKCDNNLKSLPADYIIITAHFKLRGTQVNKTGNFKFILENDSKYINVTRLTIKAVK